MKTMKLAKMKGRMIMIEKMKIKPSSIILITSMLQVASSEPLKVFGVISVEILDKTP